MTRAGVLIIHLLFPFAVFSQFAARYDTPCPEVTVSGVSICKGMSVTLAASVSSAGCSFQWQPGGATASAIPVMPVSTQDYTVSVTLNTCTVTRTLTVYVSEPSAPNVSFSYSSPVCQSQATLPVFREGGFSEGGAFHSDETLWIDPLNGQVRIGESEPGEHIIRYVLPQNGCTGAGTGTALLVIDTMITLSLPAVHYVNPGGSVELKTGSSLQLIWTPAYNLSCNTCADPVASPPGLQRYCAMSSKGACRVTACTDVVQTCDGYDRELTLPNAFSPNGDGENDRYCLEGWAACARSFNIRIFDRWGEQVFVSYDPQFCWDGHWRGQPLAADVYVYSIVAEYAGLGKVERKGNITLLR